jgi:small subunit ribosomal protein S2
MLLFFFNAFNYYCRVYNCIKYFIKYKEMNNNNKSFLSQFTLRRFLNSNVYIGHNIKQSNVDCFCYLLGIRSGMFILNVEYTLLQFRLALSFVLNVSLYKRSNVCFVGLTRFVANYVKYSALRSKQCYFVSRWINGFFSNFKEL